MHNHAIALSSGQIERRRCEWFAMMNHWATWTMIRVLFAVLKPSIRRQTLHFSSVWFRFTVLERPGLGWCQLHQGGQAAW